MLDVRNGTYLLDQGVLVKNGYVVELGEFSKIKRRVRGNVTTIDLSHLTLLPGGFASKVSNGTWKRSVPPAVAGG